MRVTPSMQDRNFLENINRTKTRLDKAQEQITTGKRVNRFSDDPFAASQSNRIAALTSTNDQFIANNELLRSKLELTDSTLQSLIQTMDSARTAAAQALSGTTTPNRGRRWQSPLEVREPRRCPARMQVATVCISSRNTVHRSSVRRLGRFGLVHGK